MNKRILLLLITSVIATTNLFNVYSLNNQTDFIREVGEDVNSINRLYLSGIVSVDNNYVYFNNGKLDLRNNIVYYNDIRINLKRVVEMELTKPDYIRYMNESDLHSIENQNLYILYIDYGETIIDTIYMRVGE